MAGGVHPSAAHSQTKAHPKEAGGHHE
jgi:hypothetical protein